MLRHVLLALAGSGGVKRALTTAPVTRDVVARFVAGETLDDALAVTRRLRSEGLLVSLDLLGEDTTDATRAAAAARAYVDVIDRLGELASGAEVSVKPTSVGLMAGPDGPKIARDRLAEICAAARAAGTGVTVDMEGHATTDATLDIVAELRADFPDLGAVIQAYLHRSEGDCRDLAGPGSRVRLVKGAYAEPETVAFRRKHDVDLAYVRCLRILMAGQGYPMVATHDPRMIQIAGALALLHERSPDSFEYQMLYGVRPDEQRHLLDLGARVRVYVPFGQEWYGYLVRRLAERPANVGFFLRALAGRG